MGRTRAGRRGGRVMPLYPHKSRRKRLENALTVVALYVILAGLAVFMSYDGEGWNWTRIIGSISPLLIAIPVGVAALIAYVRGRERQ
jgi:hypothetical protein